MVLTLLIICIPSAIAAGHWSPDLILFVLSYGRAPHAHVYSPSRFLKGNSDNSYNSRTLRWLQDHCVSLPDWLELTTWLEENRATEICDLQIHILSDAQEHTNLWLFVHHPSEQHACLNQANNSLLGSFGFGVSSMALPSCQKTHPQYAKLHH